MNYESSNISQSIIKIAEVLQNHIEEHVLNEEDESYCPVANTLLQCLELLYNNYAENDSNAVEVSIKYSN